MPAPASLTSRDGNVGFSSASTNAPASLTSKTPVTNVGLTARDPNTGYTSKD